MSLALEAPIGFGVGGEVEEFPISELRVGEGVRSGGLDERHVELLMESVDSWPPIVVWGDDPVVVDGCHRVEAARRLGRYSVIAIRFLGSPEEAFIEAVRRNVNHGLPLSVADRRRAARRVLSRNPEWSDRRIASLCGLSDKTVGRLRRVATGGIVAVDRRVGRDGKVRPVQSGQVRDRVRQALAANPGGSLRAIAAVAGASPETVRSVRASLLTGDDRSRRDGQPPLQLRPSQVPALSVLPALAPPDGAEESTAESHDWLADPALNSCGDGGDFARWFAASNVTDEWHNFIWTVPLGRAYEVVDEARRRAAAWNSFASLLECRTR
jgi:ParB-like chromosome segregation protein Spo0J